MSMYKIHANLGKKLKGLLPCPDFKIMQFRTTEDNVHLSIFALNFAVFILM